MKQIAGIALAAVSAALCAHADVLTNTWVAGSTDWSAAASYLENRVPNAGDVVVIPSGVTATVSVVSTEAANTEGSSFDVFSKLGRVLLYDATSAMVLDIAEGASVTNGCYISGRSAGRGTIIKRGLGMIEFGGNGSGAGYDLDLTVEEGALALAQALSEDSGLIFYLRKVTVNEGAMLITAEDAAHSTALGRGATHVNELWGGGIVTNRWGSSRLNFRAGNPPRSFEFSGIIGAGVRFSIGENVNLMLTGEQSTVSPELAGGGTIGFKKFGTQGQPSSMGKNGVIFRGTSGTILYLGEGETCNKTFYAWTLGNYDHVFDGGAHGDLTLTGTITYYSNNEKESVGMKRLVFTGSNEFPCVFSGTLPTWTIGTTNYNWHVTKKGIGTWRFTDKAQSHAGAWTVEDGTLQFESLAERGFACSLGTSTNLMENYGGLINTNRVVDWAFALGGATTRGTMEYIGTNDATCSTRPLALKGMGGTFASSSNAVMRFYGAYAESGVDAALTLAGDATAVTNVIGEVTDGKGRLSLVKDGEGTWTLFGTNDFSGTLAVKNGTLIVNNPANYSWFRFSVTESFGHNERAQMTELGIWDENGNRINHYLYPYTNYYSKAYGKMEGCLPEGKCAYWRPGTVSDTYSGNSIRPLQGIFDDGKALAANNTYMSPKFTVSGKNVVMTPEDPSTWMPIVMHLTNGIGRAATFDVVLTGNNTDRNVKSFIMEGSLDGIHWDSLTNIVLESEVGNVWKGSGATYSSGKSGTHTGGWPIAGGPENAELALKNVESVSVAAGARLVAWGGVAPIKGLSVDANGAGTMDGLAFSENGTLNVENLPDDGATLPGTYLNCTAFDNVAGWSLKVGGEDTKRYRIGYANGVIQIRPVGTVLLLR